MHLLPAQIFTACDVQDGEQNAITYCNAVLKNKKKSDLQVFMNLKDLFSEELPKGIFTVIGRSVGLKESHNIKIFPLKNK